MNSRSFAPLFIGIAAGLALAVTNQSTGAVVVVGGLILFYS